MSDSYQTPLRIDAGHPALAGHFPGRPVVPGVVLLERVAAALRAWRGARLEAIDAKFLRPLLPGADAMIELRGADARVRFTVTLADGGVLAQGSAGIVQA